MLKPILTTPIHGILHSVVNHVPRVQGVSIITASIVPALGVLRDGDVIGDFLSDNIDSTANYASTEGTISGVTVVITLNGTVTTAAQEVSYADSVQVVVTVTDSVGNQRIWTRTRAVMGIAPVNTVAVSISGDAELDAELTATTGTWTGIPQPELTYQWLRNDQPISSGTTYTITMADSESLISVRETATNSAGAVSVVSNVISVPSLEIPEYQQPFLSLVSKTDTTINLSGTNPDSLPDVELYEDGVLISEGSLTTWEITGLNPETSYIFTMRVGSGGNWSPMSAPLTVTTDDAGIEPEIQTLESILFNDNEIGILYDIYDKTTLFQDIDGTIPVVNDGDPIALALDISGNGYHAKQADNARRVIWRTDGELCWIQFSGSQFLYTDEIQGDLGRHVQAFAAYKKDPSSSNYSRILTLDSGSSLSLTSNQFRMAAPEVPIDSYSFGSYIDNNNQINALLRGYPVDTPNVITGFGDIAAANATVRVDGDAEITVSGITNDGASFANRRLLIGASRFTNPNGFLSGSLYAVAVRFSEPLDSFRVAETEEIVGKKAGIVVPGVVADIWVGEFE